MSASDCQLEVKVVPGSSRELIDGWLGDALKVRVTAPPEAGRANDAVVALVADALGVPRSAILITRGATSPRKLLVVSGMTDAEARARLARRITRTAQRSPRSPPARGR